MNSAGDDVGHATDDRDGDERAGGQVPNRVFRVVVHRDCLPLATSMNLNRFGQRAFPGVTFTTVGNIVIMSTVDLVEGGICQ